MPIKQSSKLLTKKPDFIDELRLQGTDGIRREVRLARSEETGLSPQETFLQLGFITEEFIEIYAYAHVKELICKEKMPTGGNVVIGWDPRDPRGNFTSALVSGVCKAGANALILGIVPTPLVPMYMLYKNALGGFMLTASHNPRDQNGVKIFCSFRGLKPLPKNDITLTRAVLEVNPLILRKLSLKGKRIDSRRDAINLFYRFSLEPKNTWVLPEKQNHLFKNIILIVDAANGSLSEIAAKVFSQVGFGQVIEVNAKLNGDVNFKSGVADLEGKNIITRKMVQKETGLFQKHLAITKLLGIGLKNRIAVTKGKLKVCGAIFDADGDRFYRLEYDPHKDALIVLNGDATAFLQAKYLMAIDPKRYKGSKYINSVESDLNTAVAVEKLGLRPVLTSVGDKWILLKIASLIFEKRFSEMKKVGGFKILPSLLQKQWDLIRTKETLDVLKLEELEITLNQFKKINKSITDESLNNFFYFAVGSEETGHNITHGSLTREDNELIPVFLGNGLKSAINTFVASQFLLESKSIRAYYYALANPFPMGFKRTFYTYYVKKELFHKNSKIWNLLKKSIYTEAQDQGFMPRCNSFYEDPDMLYISLSSKNGTRAAVFIRNSGTENKIGINLRGAKKNAVKLQLIGQKCVRILLSSMKDFENHLYKVEQTIFKQLVSGPVSSSKLKLKKPTGERVLSEMIKQELLRLTKKGYALTSLGKWYQSQKNKNG